jgi:hypothetical protein
MKSWQVTLPVAGYVIVEVEAETEAEAISKALDTAEFDMTDSETTTCHEFEAHEKLFEGNVSYVWTTKASAELLDMEDDT